MHYSAEVGHRWRPLVLFSSYNICANGSAFDVIDAACAIELIHCCTIILDDLPCVDDAPIRRNRLSCHKVYGEDVTIYASHLLYALAERLTCENAAKLLLNQEPFRKHLTQLRERLIEAQELELNLSRKNVTPCDDALIRLYELKSSPFVSAAWIGASLGGANEQERNTLSKYAMYLGMAYQLSDDISDVLGDSFLMGKPTGIDQGKVNYVTYSGIDRARELIKYLLLEAERILNQMNNDTSILSSLTGLVVKPI
jgi:geranylgeranyl diphosphate synthase type II